MINKPKKTNSNQKGLKISIVTTVRDAEPYLNSFISYHLSVGFYCIYLFFDDPGDSSIKKYEGMNGLRVIKNDSELKERWTKTKPYRKFKRFIEQEVMARQILNANVALKFALEEEIDWLLNIDSDELFYLPDKCIQDHFYDLSFKGIQLSTYLNHEAIPEKEQINDFFKEVKLFRKNPNQLNEKQIEILNNERHKQEATPTDTYFNFYSNGKSAVRVSKDVISLNCHSFDFTFIKKMNPFVNTRSKINSLVFPCILHYACCGFDFFWRKYSILGDFGDQWFDRGTEISKILPKHIESRNVCKEKDIGVAKKFYYHNFIKRFIASKDLFLKEGIYFEVELHGQD